MTQVQAELKTLQNDLKLESSTIKRLQSELEFASVEIQELNVIMYLLERNTWHEYLKQQEAWILESYTIVQNHLMQAESYIENLHVAFDGLQEEHQDALKAKDEAFATQKRQYEEAARKAYEDLKACHDHGKVLKSKIQQLEGPLTDECKDGEALEGEVLMPEEQGDITTLRLSASHSAVESQRARMIDQKSREPTERECELYHGVEPNEIAAFEGDSAAEREIEELEAERIVDGDDHDDKPDIHRSFEGDSDVEDNDVSDTLQSEKNDDGNSESVNHGDFDQAVVDQQRKARRRAKNPDKNRGGPQARKNREAKFNAAAMEQTQAQRVPHEQQAPVATVSNVQPVVDDPSLSQPAQQQVERRGGRQQQAHAQHWNDFANAARQKHDDRFAPAQQAAVRMPPSGSRYPASNGFREGRGRRGRGTW